MTLVEDEAKAPFAAPAEQLAPPSPPPKPFCWAVLQAPVTSMFRHALSEGLHGKDCAPTRAAMSAAACIFRYCIKTFPPSTASPIIMKRAEAMIAKKMRVCPDSWDLTGVCSKFLIDSLNRVGGRSHQV